MLAGDDLYVNIHAPRGECRIQVLDEDDALLAESVPVTGDLLRGEVVWQQGGLASNQGQIVSLRFTLRNASLYSYWMESYTNSIE